MIFRRLGIAILVLGIGFAGTAQAKTQYFTLAAGSGAQLHIGNGLALPIQAPAVANENQNFPPLLIPKVPGVFRVTATTTKTGTKQAITVKPGALHKPASRKTVGVWTSNPSLFAVATELSFFWPTAPAKFSTLGRTGAASTTFTAGVDGDSKIIYSPRIIGKRFGGAGRFRLRGPEEESGLIAAPITVYAVGAAVQPPCVNPLFTTRTPGSVTLPGTGTFGTTGGNANCVAFIIEALPTGVAAQGAAKGVTIMTDGANLFPAKGNGAFGTGPLHITGPRGTVSAFEFITPFVPGPTNDAQSTGYPWTTAMITITAKNALGQPEKFVISGDDTRTSMGAGTIQMVSGSLSNRNTSKLNANRAWLSLILEPNPQVPSMSALGLAATAGLMLLTAGYAMRRRIFA